MTPLSITCTSTKYATPKIIEIAPVIIAVPWPGFRPGVELDVSSVGVVNGVGGGDGEVGLLSSDSALTTTHPVEESFEEVFGFNGLDLVVDLYVWERCVWLEWKERAIASWLGRFECNLWTGLVMFEVCTANGRCCLLVALS
jgi:hypothetical protein